MKVRCIDSTSVKTALTLGRDYEVKEEWHDHYVIINDKSNLFSYNKVRFQVIHEPKEKEPKMKVSLIPAKQIFSPGDVVRAEHKEHGVSYHLRMSELSKDDTHGSWVNLKTGRRSCINGSDFVKTHMGQLDFEGD